MRRPSAERRRTRKGKGTNTSFRPGAAPNHVVCAKAMSASRRAGNPAQHADRGPPGAQLHSAPKTAPWSVVTPHVNAAAASHVLWARCWGARASSAGSALLVKDNKRQQEGGAYAIPVLPADAAAPCLWIAVQSNKQSRQGALILAPKYVAGCGNNSVQRDHAAAAALQCWRAHTPWQRRATPGALILDSFQCG
jgi:hypothetical protein